MSAALIAPLSVRKLFFFIGGFFFLYPLKISISNKPTVISLLLF